MSATLKDRVFYVFSSNAAPFEPDHAYSPFAVYALLNHGGNYEQAARTLRLEGFGGDSAPDSTGVDLSGIVGQPRAVSADNDMPPPEDAGAPDREPVPEHLLRVPGFIAELMDHSLLTCRYGQPTIAFAAALALQAFLAGRKIRDEADTRTNLYVLALANSGVGKNHPREMNQRILVEAGLHDCFGDHVASGEGIEDRLFVAPSVLFQTDEIDALILAIAKGHDPRWEGIMSVMLRFFTSSGSIYPMRVKAGQSPGIIDQPNLCLLGTAIRRTTTSRCPRRCSPTASSPACSSWRQVLGCVAAARPGRRCRSASSRRRGGGWTSSPALGRQSHGLAPGARVGRIDGRSGRGARSPP